METRQGESSRQTQSQNVLRYSPSLFFRTQVDVMVKPRQGGTPKLHKDVVVARDVEVDWGALMGPDSGARRMIPRQGIIAPLPVPDLSKKPVLLPPSTAKEKRLVKGFNEMTTTRKKMDGWEFWRIKSHLMSKGPSGVTHRSKAAFMQELGLLQQPVHEW